MRSRYPLGADSLSVLRVVSQHAEGATNREVVEELGWDKPRVFSTMANLRKAGYVSSRPSQQPIFAKNVKFRPTAKGLGFLSDPRVFSRQSRSAESGLPQISPPQLRLLRLVDSLTETLGWAPTLRELVKASGVASTNGVAEVLVRLRTKGLLTWNEMLSRTLRVTELGKAVLGPVAKRWAFIEMVQCFPCGVWRAGDGPCPVCSEVWPMRSHV